MAIDHALATLATIVGFSNTARSDKPRAMVVVVAKDSKVTGLDGGAIALDGVRPGAPGYPIMVK